MICLAARWPQRPEDATALRSAAADGVDWEAVVPASQEHRITPLVFSALKRCNSPDVPVEVIAELRRQSVLDAQRMLAQVAELNRLSRLFAEAGIQVLVLKGAALATQLFGESSLRLARDIDFYVCPEDIERADLVLHDAGYKSNRDTLATADQAVCWRWVKDNEYFHAISGGCVELHSRLTDNPDLLPWDFASLWSEREELRVGEVTVATLARNRLALYLCVHGATHGWKRLRWLVDFAAQLRAEPEASCCTAIVTAENAGLGPLMLQALALAHHWLGAPAADQHLRRAAKSPAVARLDFLLGRFLGTGLFSASQPGSWARFRTYSFWLRLYHLMMKPGRRYWALEIARALVSPADRAMLRLPPTLSGLYPLIRPVAWLVRRRYH